MTRFEQMLNETRALVQRLLVRFDEQDAKFGALMAESSKVIATKKTEAHEIASLNDRVRKVELTVERIESLALEAKRTSNGAVDELRTISGAITRSVDASIGAVKAENEMQSTLLRSLEKSEIERRTREADRDKAISRIPIWIAVVMLAAGAIGFGVEAMIRKSAASTSQPTIIVMPASSR
jgi:hypothetical protein